MTTGLGMLALVECIPLVKHVPWWNGIYHKTTNACLSGYPGYFREPRWKSMGLPEISRINAVMLQRLLIQSLSKFCGHIVAHQPMSCRRDLKIPNNFQSLFTTSGRHWVKWESGDKDTVKVVYRIPYFIVVFCFIVVIPSAQRYIDSYFSMLLHWHWDNPVLTRIIYQTIIMRF